MSPTKPCEILPDFFYQLLFTIVFTSFPVCQDATQSTAANLLVVRQVQQSDVCFSS